MRTKRALAQGRKAPFGKLGKNEEPNHPDISRFLASGLRLRLSLSNASSSNTRRPESKERSGTTGFWGHPGAEHVRLPGKMQGCGFPQGL